MSGVKGNAMPPISLQFSIENLPSIKKALVKVEIKPQSSVFIQNRYLNNPRNEHGETILHLLAKTSKASIVQYVISCGSDVDSKDNEGKTPLMTAVTVSEDVPIVAHLLNANANIYATDYDGKSALRMVIEKSRIWLASLKPKETHLVILLMFFDKVKDDFFVDRTLALQRLQSTGVPKALVPFIKNTQVRKYLFESNIALEECLNGLTPLHVAVMSQDLVSVKILVARGVNVNAVDDRRQTALFAHDPSAMYGAERFTILRILLHHGASLYIARDDGVTPMEYFLKEGKSRTIWTVLESSATFLGKCGPSDKTAIHFLVENENLSCTPREPIKFLWRRGLNVNALDNNGCSALTYAVKHEFDKKIEFLLKLGAEANWIEIVENTPMLDVFMNGYYEKRQGGYYQWVVQMIFLQQGMNVRNLFEELNKGFTRKLDNLFYGQIVIAHLAIAESTGQRIPETTLEYIKSETVFNVHYEICKEKIEEMKNIVVYESLTFYQLLIADDHEIHRYICNQEFLLELKLLMSERSYQNSYYYVLVRKRIESAVNIMQLRKEAGSVVCEGTGMNSYGLSGDHYAVHKIVSYLSNRDIQNLFEDQLVSKAIALPSPRTQQVEGNILSRAIRAFFARTDQ